MSELFEAEEGQAEGRHSLAPSAEWSHLNNHRYVGAAFSLTG